MIRKLSLFALAVAALAALYQPAPVHAAGAYMCAPESAGTAPGPRRVVNTSSTAATQPSYSLNGAGCAFIAQADVGFFQSQGFTFGLDGGVIIYTTGVATSTTNFAIGRLPANAYIATVIYDNAVAAAVTGGITLGTTAGGTDIATATTCGAGCLAQATDAQLVKRAWSKTAQTTINMAAATDWNSANVTVTVIWRYF